MVAEVATSCVTLGETGIAEVRVGPRCRGLNRLT